MAEPTDFYDRIEVEADLALFGHRDRNRAALECHALRLDLLRDGEQIGIDRIARASSSSQLSATATSPMRSGLPATPEKTMPGDVEIVEQDARRLVGVDETDPGQRDHHLHAAEFAAAEDAGTSL